MNFTKIHLNGELTLLSQGRRSKVYTFDQGKVLKLYEKDFPKERIIGEYEKSLIVNKISSLNTPKALEIVKVGQQIGIIFERVSGIAYMDLFSKYPWKYFGSDKIVKKLFRLDKRYLRASGFEFDKSVGMLFLASGISLARSLDRRTDHHKRYFEYIKEKRGRKTHPSS